MTAAETTDPLFKSSISRTICTALVPIYLIRVWVLRGNGVYAIIQPRRVSGIIAATVGYPIRVYRTRLMAVGVK